MPSKVGEFSPRKLKTMSRCNRNAITAKLMPEFRGRNNVSLWESDKLCGRFIYKGWRQTNQKSLDV